MSGLLNKVQPSWHYALVVISVAILATIIYDYGWHVGLPIMLRNIAGIILFSCIMLGAGIAYIGARVHGDSAWKATKIAILVPMVWHIKEMSISMKFYGVAAGVYSGLQGPYLFYYCIIFMVLGLFHFVYQLILKSQNKAQGSIVKSTGVFFLPMLILGGLEGGVMTLFGFDLFVFQGFLAGYRTFIM